METPSKYYGLRDTPPAAVLFTNAAQHVGVIAAINIAFPILVVGVLPPGTVDEGRFLGLAFLILGLGTLLQSFPGRRIGSGLLVPTTFTAAYLPGTIAAASAGGLPLVAGMLLFAGCIEIILGIFIRRIRHLVSIEIAGLVILTIGLLLGMVGFRLILSLDQTGQVVARPDASPALGACVLALMVFASIYLPGRLKTLAALFGVLAGLLLAPLFGALPDDAIQTVTQAPLLGLPIPYVSVPTFDLSLAPAFLLAAFACAFRAAGDITNSQKSSDADWKRPDYRQISRGVVADGLTTVTSAAIGSLGTNTFSGSVGLATQAGVMSRRVAVVVGLAMIVIALLPPVRAIALLVPREVSGAVLIFSAAFIIMGGIRVIASRALSNQRTLLVGLPLFLTSAHDAYPIPFGSLPTLFATFMRTDLTIAVFTALTLRLLLGFQRSKEVSETLSASDALAAGIEMRKAAEAVSISSTAADRAQSVTEMLFRHFHDPQPGDDVTSMLSANPDRVKLTFNLPARLVVLPQSPPPSPDLVAHFSEMHEKQLLRTAERAEEMAIRIRGDMASLTFVFDE